MRWLMVALLLYGVALLLGCWVVFYPHPGSFARAPHWERVWLSESPAYEWVYDMDFADAQRGWLCTSGPTLTRTSDGGSTWREQKPAGRPMRPLSLDFADERVAWAVEGDGHAVDVTTDGGASWQSHPLGPGYELRGIAAISATEAWATGPPVSTDDQYHPTTCLYHTTDGGVTWREVSLPVRWHDVWLEAISFVDKTHGWIVAAERAPRGEDVPAAEARPIYIMRTTDGGKSFATSAIAPGGSFHGSCRLSFGNRQEGWVALGWLSLLHTGDGGKTWQRVTPQAAVTGGKKEGPVALEDCSFPTSKSGWVVGGGGLVLHTRDGGKTWQRELTGTETLRESILMRVVIVDERHGWVYGNGGDEGADMIPHPAHMMSFVLRYVP